MPRQYSKNTEKPSKPGRTNPAGKGRQNKNIRLVKGTSRKRAGMPTPGKKTFSTRPETKRLRLLERLRNRFRRKSNPSRPGFPSPRPIPTGLSLDRKLDILGIILSLLGFLTLLAALSTNHSSLTGEWVFAISQTFGWGLLFFPLACMAIGLWLVLRNFERIPQLSVERILGVTLLYINLLAFLHFFTFPETSKQTYEFASAGKGGGYLGGFFFEALRTNLGYAGTAVALLAWLLIALALTLDVSVIDLFRWIGPLVVRVQDWWDDRRNHKEALPARPAILSSGLNLPGNQKMPSVPASGIQGYTPAGSAGMGPAFTPGVTGPARSWVLPSLDQVLDKGSEISFDDEVDRQRSRVIEETLASFGAPVNVVEINRGPTITQFGVEPDFIETRNGRMRVRVGKIASLADDLALALSAKRIRVEAPVPGKGYVGIEVPNDQIANVALRDVIESEAFRRLKSSLRFAIGQDVAGNAAAADLSSMPHLLIAGATGSGKSVCVNALICCLLLNNTPEDLRMVMVDPKRVELTGYNGIPHLLAPVVVETERVVGALQWILREMDMRYHKLAQAGCRNIVDYNTKVVAQGEKKLPYLVVLIDELADLMMLAPDETERAVTRLAQLARATGIHLVIATQRPSVDVVTGLIKANFPARIAFAVASGVDSRVILDQPGAERLLGRGDMLFQAPDAPAPIRLQGAFVSEGEIQRLVQAWISQAGITEAAPMAAGGAVDTLPAGVPLKQMPLWEEMMQDDRSDPILNEAIDLCRRQGRASISMLQRRLRVGYTRAARLIETMQEKGIIGTEQGAQGFEILDYGPAAPPVEEQGE